MTSKERKTYTTVGCEKCNNTGFYGRIGIFEVLNITENIKRINSKRCIKYRNKKQSNRRGV